MPSLLHDRFLVVTAAQARDLATGDLVLTETLADIAPPRVPELPALVEVLEHGRDGEPRAVRAEVRPPARWRPVAERIAADAASRGYVPVGVEVYASLGPMIGAVLSGRTLALIARADQARAGRRALLDAAAACPGPHVLITLCGGADDPPLVARESRAAYATPLRRRPGAVVPSDVQQLLQRAARAGAFAADGRHAAAERLLRDVSAALTRRMAWAHAAAVTVGLGRLLLERGRPLDAVRVFTSAAGASASAVDDEGEADARIWLAVAHTDADQLTAAESICRALLIAGGLSEPRSVWVHAVLARVLLWQGRVGEAVDLAIDTRNGSEELEPSVHASVQSTVVALLVTVGRLFDAGVCAGALAGAAGPEPLTRAIALTSRLRVLAASGDLGTAEAAFHDAAVAARLARAPLRLVRARLIWLDAMRRAGRRHDADRQMRLLARASRVAPPLLRRAIRRRLDPAPTVPRTEVQGPEVRASAAALIRTTQEEEDDGRAVTRVMEEVVRGLRATRVDLWSADAGPSTIVRSVGTGLPSTIGRRVIEAGIVIASDGNALPRELGLPVRVGSRVIAALVGRWPADRLPPANARDLLELVAAVAALRVDALLQRARLASEAATLIPELVGVSGAIGEVRQAVARAAAAPFAVLVEGESGVGKELIARAVHYLSPRRERRFCDVNCAALPDDLLESELFGHARGAFTGAVVDRPGLFEEAHGGTLFLDEVADLSARAQAKLLRVLQQQEIRRVGETFARPVDVRLVTAANRDMRGEASGGRFRQDLLYRIDVIRIGVPALRDRPEDIPVLARHFWRSAADRVGTVAVLSPGVLAALATYHWPGNVRQLQNVMAALAVAAPPRGAVPADLLPAAITGATPIRTARLAEARDQFERRFVEVALAQAGGSRARAARALGVSRQGLLKLIARLRVPG